MRISDQYIWNFLFTLFFVSLVVSGTVILDSVAQRPLTTPSAMEFFLLALATLRVTRLFVYDKITAFLREQFYDVVEVKNKRYLEKPARGPRRTIADLLSCPWCFGAWAAATIVFFYYLALAAFFPILFLAVAGAASILQIVANFIGWKAEAAKGEVEG